jgi:hypothetical protein
MLWAMSVMLLLLWVVGLISGLALGPWVHLLLVLGVAALAVSAFRRAQRHRVHVT